MTPDAHVAVPHLSPEASLSDTPAPPSARRDPVEHLLHGDRRIDHYAWLREKDNPEVIAHLSAENAYTDAVLRPTLPFQEKLYQQMLGRDRKSTRLNSSHS